MGQGRLDQRFQSSCCIARGHSVRWPGAPTQAYWAICRGGATPPAGRRGRDMRANFGNAGLARAAAVGLRLCGHGRLERAQDSGNDLGLRRELRNSTRLEGVELRRNVPQQRSPLAVGANRPTSRQAAGAEARYPNPLCFGRWWLAPAPSRRGSRSGKCPSATARGVRLRRAYNRAGSRPRCSSVRLRTVTSIQLRRPEPIWYRARTTSIPSRSSRCSAILISSFDSSWRR